MFFEFRLINITNLPSSGKSPLPQLVQTRTPIATAISRDVGERMGHSSSQISSFGEPRRDKKALKKTV